VLDGLSGRELGAAQQELPLEKGAVQFARPEHGSILDP
jgi:hypothetical protein